MDPRLLHLAGVPGLGLRRARQRRRRRRRALGDRRRRRLLILALDLLDPFATFRALEEPHMAAGCMSACRIASQHRT